MTIGEALLKDLAKRNGIKKLKRVVATRVSKSGEKLAAHSQLDKKKIETIFGVKDSEHQK